MSARNTVASADVDAMESARPPPKRARFHYADAPTSAAPAGGQRQPTDGLMVETSAPALTSPVHAMVDVDHTPRSSSHSSHSSSSILLVQGVSAAPPSQELPEHVSDVRMPAQVGSLEDDEVRAPPLCVYRCTLCFCSLAGAAAAAPPGDLSPTSGSVLMGLRMEEDEEANGENAHPPIAADLTHTSACQSVLVKTSIGMSTTPEQVARLRYEFVLQERLYAAASNVASNATSTAAAAGQQSSNLTVACGNQEQSSVGHSSPHAVSVAPHLRQLPDGRFALICNDIGGSTLQQLNRQRIAIEARKAAQQLALVQQRDGVAPPAAAARAGAIPSLATLSTALDFTLAITRKLHTMHSISLVHSNLNPSNILINPISHEASFLDLSASSLIQTGRTEVNDLLLAGKSSAQWLYSAPEQSGKANRIVDQRSDLYSLGVILYESLAGRPPFQSNDSLELIHQHLAKAPPKILDLLSSSKNGVDRHRGRSFGSSASQTSAATASVPDAVDHGTSILRAGLTVVDAICGKLLCKQAEDRYQSTSGLIHDIRFLRQWLKQAKWMDSSTPASVLPSPIVDRRTRNLSNGALTPSSSSSGASTDTSASSSALQTIRSFTVGSVDLYSTFRLSQRLFGREQQISALTSAYQRVCAPLPSSTSSNALQLKGTTDGRLSIGPGGSRTRPQLFLIRGRSGVGKTSLVDELHKHVVRQRGTFARGKFDLYRRDSSCLLSAFRALIVQLQVTDATAWKVRIGRAIGPNGAVLTAVMPELIGLIGEQPPVAKLSASDNVARFNQSFVAFVGSLSSAASPLALFIDDLQWADSGSLSLLSLLCASTSNSHLLIIGAYRSNEVDLTHPLMRLIDEIRNNDSDGEQVCMVELNPLEMNHLTALTVDSFRCTEAVALPLAQLLYSKTLGNPFHVATLLKSWFELGLLFYNFSTAQWEWQLEAMRATAMSPDVVGILCAQMLSLKPAAQTFLRFASCSGNAFNLASLHIITQMPATQLIAAACELVQQGMLMCTTRHQDLVLLDEELRQTASCAAEEAAAMSSAGSSHGAPRHSSPTPSVLIPVTAMSTPIEHAPSLHAQAKLAGAKAASAATPSAASSATASPSIRAEEEIATTARLSKIQLRFQHDRFQAAAYSMIPPAELPRYHLTIAHQLLSTYSEKECQEHALNISSHINAGLRIGVDTEEAGDAMDTSSSSSASASSSPVSSKDQWNSFFSTPALLDRVIQLLLVAGMQAKAASAYDTAISLFIAASHLIARRQQDLPALKTKKRKRAVSDGPLASPTGPSMEGIEPEFIELSAACWSECYDTCLILYRKLSTAFYLMCSYRQASLCIDYMLRHITDIHDRGSMFELRLQAKAQFDMKGSVEGAFAGIAELGIELIPDMPAGLLLWVEAYPDLTDPSTYKQHPVFAMQNTMQPLEAYAMAIMSSATPTMFYLGDARWTGVTNTMMELTRKRGLSPEGAYSFCLFSLQMWPLAKMAQQFATAETSLLMIRETGELGRRMIPRINTAVCLACLPWNLPYSVARHRVELAFEEALELLDNEWAGHLGLYIAELYVNEQQPLFAPSKALVKQRQIVEVLTKKKFMFPAQYGSVWLTFNEMLAGEKPSHPRIPASERSGLVDLLKCGLWITDGLLRYLERDLEEAHACFTEAGKYIATSPAIPINLSYSFYRALTALASATPVHASVTLTIEADGMKANFPRAYDAKRVIERLAEADVIIQRMAPWPQKATFDHKRQLLAAERMRVCALSHLGRVDLVLPACAMYEKAAAGASKNGFPLDAALSLELLGRFLFSVDRSTYGLDVMRKAVVAYEAFGAKPKGLRLREEFTALSHDDSSLLQQHLRSTVLRSRTQAGADSAHPPSASTGSASAAAAATVVPNGAVGLNRFSASANAFDAISVLKATASFSTEKSQPKLLKKLMRIVLETAGATRGVLCLEQSNKEWSVELSASVDFDEKRSRSRTWRRNALEEEEGGDEDEKGEDDADRAVGMDLDDPDEHKAAAAEEDTHMEDASVSHPSLGGGHRGHDRSSSSSSTSTGGHHIRLGVNAPLDSTAIGAALPLSVFEFVTNTKEVLVVNVHSPTFSAFARASYFADQRHKPKALLCMPLLKAGSVFGVLYLENDFNIDAFTSSHIQLLSLLCTQAALSIDNARLLRTLTATNSDLETLVARRTNEIDNLQIAMDRAEKATKIKSDFLSNMSHEIRTPMNAVLGIGRLLADTPLTLEQQQYVQMISNSSNLLLTIINDILDFSKIEAGHLTLSPTPQNLVDVVETAVLLVYDMASSKGLLASYYIDPSIAPLLLVDRTRLSQILLNLLSNAIKFTKCTANEQGTVDVTVTLRSPGTNTRSPMPLIQPQGTAMAQAEAPQEIEFRVKDSGIGISSSQLSSLFLAFSQVNHASGQFGGTGLGLVISKRLVEAMSGSIHVESFPGRGSTFSFVLPLTPVHSPGEHDSAGSMDHLGLASGSVIQLHGLSPSDLVTLGRARMMYVGEHHMASSGWVKLARYYNATVETVLTLQEALQKLGPHTPLFSQLSLPAAAGAAASSSSSSSSPPPSKKSSLFVDVLILDMDSLVEDSTQCMEMLQTFVGLKVLMLKSKPTAALAASMDGMGGMGDEVDENGVSHPTNSHLTNGALPRERSITAPIVTSSPLSAQYNRSSESSASPQQLAPRTLNGLTFSSIRKPFAARSYLRQLISLLSPPSTTGSPRGGTPPQRPRRMSVTAWPKEEDMLGGSMDTTAAAAAAAAAAASEESTSLLKVPHLSSRAQPSTSAKIANIQTQYPLRILLAEDNVVNQKLMVMILKKLGYSLIIAKNGTEALRMLERERARGPEHAVECILMDASMDVMDGMECTRIIRAQQQANQLRPFIIAQTANVTEEFRKACLDAGMDLFCSKPIDVCDLQTALKRAYNWHHRDDLSALPPPPPATPGVPAPPSLGRRVVHAVDGSSTPPEQPEAAPVVAPEEWKQDEAVVSCVGFGFGPHDHGCMAKA